jgi:hypothetical protein
MNDDWCNGLQSSNRFVLSATGLTRLHPERHEKSGERANTLCCDKSDHSPIFSHWLGNLLEMGIII